jgi:hypothetical protein
MNEYLEKGKGNDSISTNGDEFLQKAIDVIVNDKKPSDYTPTK